MRRPALAAGLAVLALAAAAQEFRAINPIRAPRVAAPAEGERVVPPNPPSREKVEAAVNRVMGSWNTAELAKHLAQGFYDRDRLSDALATKVPRDATLRVLGIQSSQLLDQFRVPAGRYPTPAIVSRVAVAVRTQVEFTDATGAFQRREGVNEFVLDIPEPAP